MKNDLSPRAGKKTSHFVRPPKLGPPSHCTPLPGLCPPPPPQVWHPRPPALPSFQAINIFLLLFPAFLGRLFVPDFPADFFQHSLLILYSDMGRRVHSIVWTPALFPWEPSQTQGPGERLQVTPSEFLQSLQGGSWVLKFSPDPKPSEELATRLCTLVRWRHLPATPGNSAFPELVLRLRKVFPVGIANPV